MREPYTYVTLRAENGENHRITFYEFLDVAETSTYEELKKAYRKKCFDWHPDRNMGDKSKESMFKALQIVWKELSDETLRALYDRRLAIDRGQIKPRQQNISVRGFDFWNSPSSTTTTTSGWFYSGI